MGFVAAHFDAVCRRSDPVPAVVDGEASLQYGGLLRWSEAISSRLERHHRIEGSRVALMLPNSAAFIASFFGVARAGGVVAPLNVAYRSQELEHYLADMQAAAVLVNAATADRVLEAGKRLARRPAVFLVDSPGTCEALTLGDTADRQEPCGGDPPLLLLYTSGSTGSPKRVIRTHGQLLAEGRALGAVFGVAPSDRFLGAAPFSHVNGLVRTMLTAMLAGATVYPVQHFARRPILQLVGRERLTIFGGVPQMFVLLAHAPPREAVDVSSLRVIFSASAPLRPEDNHAFHRAYGVFIRQLYGSTETGTISYNDHPNVEHHLESVGPPLAGIRLAVLGEDGVLLRPGREGEIAVSSPFAVSCYDGNPCATRTSFRDAWYLTGDLGRTDAHDNVTLTGRKSLMINRGGYKVNPHEVEEAIRQHSKVVDVVVVGEAGRHGDQIIRSVIEASEHCDAEEIILHCRSRIADYKIPSRIEFRESLPRTPTGKIRRGEL
jgi:long-chain acyl-CoA synthetase